MVQDNSFTMADWPIGRRIESHTWSIKQCHFNDLERPLTHISRSGHYWTLNISETVR